MKIDKNGSIPIYEQIVENLKSMILTGVIKPDEKLPSVRELSLELLVNPNTIQKAYSQLERLNICSSSPGNGRFVCENAIEILKSESEKIFEEIKKQTGELYKMKIPLNDILSVVKEEYKNQQAK